MADFDFRQLAALCAVIERSGFSAAAKHLGLAQATVSERIASLERSLGVALFDRRGRSVAPTPAGELAYARARRLLQSQHAMTDEVRALADRRLGTVEITCSTIPGEYLLPSILASFFSAHPQVAVIANIHDSATVAEMVTRGDTPIGLLGTAARGLDLRPLCQDEVVIAVTPGHPLAKHKRIKPAQLADLSLLTRQSGSGTQAAFDEALFTALGVRRVIYRVAARLNSNHAIVAACVAGAGPAIVSSLAAADAIARGELMSIRVQGLKLKRTLYLATRKRARLTRLESAFADFVVDNASKQRR